MAYSDKEWEAVRVDREVHSLSYSAIAKKHPMSKASIINKSNSEGWNKGKADHLISKKVINKQELVEIGRETDQLTKLEAKEVDKAVSFALEMSGIYENLEKEIANKTLDIAKVVEPSDPMASVSVKNLAQTLQALKDKGKIGTQVNIQNNGSVIPKSELKTLTLSELRELRETL